MKPFGSVVLRSAKGTLDASFAVRKATKIDDWSPEDHTAPVGDRSAFPHAILRRRQTKCFSELAGEGTLVGIADRHRN